MNQKYFLSIFLALWSLSAMAEELRPGPWRFELRTANAAVPFIVELNYDAKKRLIGKLHNGLETIPLDNIIYRKNELRIPIRNYEISMQLSVDRPIALNGFLVRHNKNPEVRIPLVGIHGEKERFPQPKEKPTIDLGGKWLMEVSESDGKKGPAVGTFEQKGNYLTGSILTMTGDYRYMEGYVSGNTFEAASFDGVYNYVFKGTVKDGLLEGQILSNSSIPVRGQRDPKAMLPSPYSQTSLKKLQFIFPDLNGKHVNLRHPKFENKAVVVQIFGSWCPNCLDEMEYLIPWYRENSKRGVEVVALAFERSLSAAEATRQLKKTQRKFDVPYPILQAGSTSEDKPAELIKGLENFISFPTLIFLNRKHEVVKVHAGFTGPSTGEFYQQWKKEFNQTVNEILK